MRTTAGIVLAITACLLGPMIMASSAQFDASKEPGIYLIMDGKEIMVSSTPVDKAAPAGIMANAASFGFKGVDIKAQIEGAKSNLRVASGPTEFIFRGDSFKPEEYSLVKVEVKDDRREMKTGKVGMMGRVKADVDKDAIVRVKASKLEERHWKVMPERSLAPGEYAFVLTSPAPDRVFSFGIDN